MIKELNREADDLIICNNSLVLICYLSTIFICSIRRYRNTHMHGWMWGWVYMLRLQHSRLSDVENILPKEKKERKKRTFSFWLTIYGVLCVKVSSPLHLIWRHSERRVITNPFTFTSHYYLISETMCQSSQRPLILWLPGINICRNTRKARLKLWHRCENSWK